MPRLRVLVGSSTSNLVDASHLVNTTQAHKVSSSLFEGKIAVNIKGFPGEDGQVRESGYFSLQERQGITWSIQVQGRFLKSYSADDILFGNTFERPLHLPWGSGAALTFMKYIDPTLEHDLASQSQPWALSPLISTMPHFVHSVEHAADALPPFPPDPPLHDDVTQLKLPDTSEVASASSTSLSSLDSAGSSSGSSVSSTSSKSFRKLRKKSKRNNQLQTASQRRSFFSAKENRQLVHFGPNDLITTDFCYGFLEFHPSLSLRLPGGLSFDLMRYWDGQPVRFVCCERKGDLDPDNPEPWGRVFWCVVIELNEDSHA